MKEDMIKKIESLKTEKGGWTKASLASLGVPWPPPQGWKERLIMQAGQCNHKWYMREAGITCVNCLIIWDKSMDTDSESLDS
jgi:hypothetical protein